MVDDQILLSQPHLTGDEEKMVAQAFDSGWVALLGPQVDAFESELAEVTGNRFALATASGTAAIHLALLVLGVGPGDVVLCSSLTFVASAAPIKYCGASPVFVDADPETWNMDPQMLDDALETLASEGTRPKAAIVVDLFGQSADFDPILGICSRHGIPVVEDAAEALGGTYRDRPTGSSGRLSILSFNGNKIVTTSGGGALLSDDQDLIDRAFFLANQAQDAAPHYQHSVVGYNYRLSNILASVGQAQLAHLHDRVRLKRKIFDRYVAALAESDDVRFMPEAAYGRSTHWLSALTIDRGEGSRTRDLVVAGLRSRNIESRPVWKPMHLQPVFAGSRAFGGTVSEYLFETGLCLPSGTSMTEADQDRVITQVESVLSH